MSIFLLFWHVWRLGHGALGFLAIGGIPRVVRLIDAEIIPHRETMSAWEWAHETDAALRRIHATRVWLIAYHVKCGGSPDTFGPTWNAPPSPPAPPQPPE